MGSLAGTPNWICRPYGTGICLRALLPSGERTVKVVGIQPHFRQELQNRRVKISLEIV